MYDTCLSCHGRLYIKVDYFVHIDNSFPILLVHLLFGALSTDPTQTTQTIDGDDDEKEVAEVNYKQIRSSPKRR